MADTNFIIKNGLVVNAALTVNNSTLSYSKNVATIGTALYVVSNGNLGVGNNAPADKISVNGTSYLYGNITIATTAGINANNSYGTAGQALLSNGSAVYWATATAGSNTYIQFNDSSSAGATADFTYDKVSKTLYTANALGVGTSSPAGKFNVSDGTVIGEINPYAAGSGCYIGTRSNHAILFEINATQKAVLDTSGNFGIGNTAPAAKLHVQGDVVVSGDITSAYSDDRLKTRFSNITEALDKVKQINGFTYVPNDLAIALGVDIITPLDKKVGVSAQEIEKVLPEAVKQSSLNPEYLTVQYERIIPLLIEAIKELEIKVEKLSSVGGK